MFGRLTDWRRLTLRFERCAHTVVSAMCLAATGIFWLSLTRPDPRFLEHVRTTLRLSEERFQTTVFIVEFTQLDYARCIHPALFAATR